MVLRTSERSEKKTLQYAVEGRERKHRGTRLDEVSEREETSGLSCDATEKRKEKKKSHEVEGGRRPLS